MLIFLFCQSYGKGHAATAHYSVELAEFLADKGHDIIVLTGASPYHPPGTEVIGGVKVFHLGNPKILGATSRYLREILLWIYFFYWLLHTNLISDIIICQDTPRFFQFAALIHRRKFGTKIVSWVMDMPLEQIKKRSTDNWIIRTLASGLSNLQFQLLKFSDVIVTLGGCMKQLLSEGGIPPSDISIIGSWSNDAWDNRRIEPTQARLEFAQVDRFTVMYSGYAAEWHDFDTICKTLLHFLNHKEIQFLFSGSGPGIKKVLDLIDKYHPSNISVLPRVDQASLQTFLSCGDIHLVSLHPSMLGTCIPSKVYPIMAIGRPTIFIGPLKCQTAVDLLNANSGIVVDKVQALIQSILQLKNDPSLVREMSKNASAAYKSKHSSSISLNDWRQSLESIAVR